MKLPPALSWMHLFAREVSYECDASVPEWLRTQIQVAKPHSGKIRVRVGGDDCGKLDGFVGINSRFTDRDLAGFGFAYVRRFAVLPDMQTARWFVALDSPAVSAAAFSLYSPARFSARMKVAAAKLATYSRLPVWYRDEVLIAQRTAPPIEQRLSELFAGAEFRVALSSGAPEPARNRKVSLAAIAPDGKLLGFAKLAGSDLSLRLLHDEARVLPELRRRGIAAPELIFAGEIDGTFVMLQKPVDGKPIALHFTPEARAFLRTLRSTRIHRASECDMVASLPGRIASLASHPALSDALHDVLPTLEQMRVPSTIIHGDFAPWNLRSKPGTVACFDWEYCQLDGLPLIDETHFRLQVGYLLEKWDLPRAGKMIDDILAITDLGLSREQVRTIVVVYLIDNLTRLFGEGYDDADNEMVAWYGQLLKRLLTRTPEVAPT